MDDSENWNKGNRLMSVLLHQIGHLFGLDHSSNPKSVMSPLFNFHDSTLLEEDIRNLRVILGLDASEYLYLKMSIQITNQLNHFIYRTQIFTNGNN